MKIVTIQLVPQHWVHVAEVPGLGYVQMMLEVVNGHQMLFPLKVITLPKHVTIEPSLAVEYPINGTKMTAFIKENNKCQQSIS